MLNLNSPDFTTALRVAEAINKSLKSNFAQALDAVSVVVKAPADSASRVGFLSHLELLEVEVDVDTGGPTNLITLARGVTLQEVVKALNRVGASTNDLISILVNYYGMCNVWIL